jgi:tetratricopeptide (TPR) repeat protein
MFKPTNTDLTQANKFIKEGKYQESLQILKDFEERESDSLQDIVSCHLVKGYLFFRQGLMIKAAKLAEQTYKESLGLEKNIMSVDALLLRAHALFNIYDVKLADKITKQGEELLKTLTEEPIINKNQREASIFCLKGMSSDPSFSPPGDVDLALKYYKHSLDLAESHDQKDLIIVSLLRSAWDIGAIKGNLDLALDLIERALVFSKELNDKLYILWALSSKGTMYSIRGEVTRCIPLYKHSLEMARELKHKGFTSGILNNLAEGYRMKGELDRALECSLQSLEILSEIGGLKYIANVHDFLIQILVEKGDLEQAQQYLNILEELNNQLEDKLVNEMYLYNKALILKESSRIINQGKAEEILKQTLEDEPIFLQGTHRSLLTLCELLLAELQMTGDLEVLEEVKSYIVQLLEIAEKSNKFWIWGETYLLQAKLALISLNLEKARKLLTQGQQIAEKYGLDLLANKISNEHDNLLQKLSMWENLKESDSPLNERIKLAGLNEQVKNMIRRRVINVNEFSDEEPVFLLIVSEGGKPIFSQSFVEDQLFEDHLFGGFLSAINSFISEMFSEGLDRVIFGEHTILVNSLSNFFVCYVFKGQSYSAQLRIKSFIDELQSDEEVWHTFEKFYKTNKEVQLKDVPSLKPLIKETFIDSVIY